MKPDSKRSFSIPFDPVGRPTVKKPRSISIAMGPRARREAVSVPSTSRVRRPLYDWHLGRERFLKREEEAFRAAPEHLDAIPKIFRHPYWRMRLGHALERAFAAENTALSDPGYVEQASGFLLTDLRRGAGRTATNPDAVPEYFSFDPDLGETGEEEYESDDFFDETSEDEELLPEAPEPEDDDVFDDESDDGETLSFLAPVGPDDPVAKAFREYWETTEAQPEYRRQLEVIEKACDKEFFDWFSLNMDDIRRSCFLAGNTSGYFTMPRPALLVRVLREAAKDEFPDEDWSPEVARDARFLRALWRLPRVNYALLAVSGVTGAVLGSIVAWYPTFIPVISSRVPNWEALTLAVRKRLWETEEGRRALAEVERLAAEDERLRRFDRVVLFGHSWGAFSVMNCAEEKRVAGVVAMCGFISSAAVVAQSAVGQNKKKRARAFWHILFPWLYLLNKTSFGENANKNSLDSLLATKKEVLLMYGEKDNTVYFPNNGAILQEKLKDKKNIRFQSYQDKGHNVYLTCEAEREMNRVFGEIAKVPSREKARLKQMYANVNYEEITQEDKNVMGEAIRFCRRLTGGFP